MKLRASTHVTPISDLRKRAAEILDGLEKDREPVLITSRGRSKAVLEDVRDYEARIERLRLLESILRGLTAAERGETLSHRDAMKELEELLDG